MEFLAWSHANIGLLDLERALARHATGVGAYPSPVYINRYGRSAFRIETSDRRMRTEVLPTFVTLSGDRAHQVTVASDDGSGEVLARGELCPGRCSACYQPH